MTYSLAERKNQLRRCVTHALRACGRVFTHSPRVVVSLTSYPARIETVHVSMQSLLAQHHLPDLIVLYLCKQDFPHGEADLPESLRRLLAHDVCIRWVEGDLKSHKKYFYALQEFACDYVITVDDDLIYRNTMIDELLSAQVKHPHAICAMRTHLIEFSSDGELAPYANWILEAPITHERLVGVESMRLFVTTGAGTLFPPKCLPAQTFDERAIRSLCLYADDVWINVMRIITHAPVVAVTSNQALVYVPDTQEVGLFHTNLEGTGNDDMLRAVFDAYAALGIAPSAFADDTLDTLL